MARRNAVSDAVDKVGGPVQAAAIMHCSVDTVYKWREAGEIRLAKPAYLLWKKTGLPLEELIGVDEGGGTKN